MKKAQGDKPFDYGCLENQADVASLCEIAEQIRQLMRKNIVTLWKIGECLAKAEQILGARIPDSDRFAFWCPFRAWAKSELGMIQPAQMDRLMNLYRTFTLEEIEDVRKRYDSPAFMSLMGPTVDNDTRQAARKLITSKKAYLDQSRSIMLREIGAQVPVTMKDRPEKIAGAFLDQLERDNAARIAPKVKFSHAEGKKVQLELRKINDKLVNIAQAVTRDKQFSRDETREFWHLINEARNKLREANGKVLGFAYDWNDGGQSENQCDNVLEFPSKVA